jgi:hypothetical protein
MNPLTKAYLETTTASFSLPFPSSGKVLVKKGDSVAADQVLAKGERVVEKEINLVITLRIPPKKIFDFLTKSLGSKISQGELLAERKGIFGKKQIFSPYEGTLESLSEEGVLKIKVAQEKVEIKTPLAGKVTAIGKDNLEISFPARKIVGVWGIGGQALGQLVVLGSQEKEVSLFDIKGDLQGKVVAFSGELTPGFWHKAVACGLMGIVCGKLSHEQFSQGLEREASLPLLVVGDGKEGLIKDEIWQTIKASQEKMVVLNGGEKSLLIPR